MNVRDPGAGPKNLDLIPIVLHHKIGHFVELTKLFPGDVYGPNMVKGLMAPCPWSKIMVTGGVSPDRENLTSWFKAGVYCVGMGSKLFPKEAIADKRWEVVTELCRSTLEIIAAYRK